MRRERSQEEERVRAEEQAHLPWPALAYRESAVGNLASVDVPLGSWVLRGP